MTTQKRRVIYMTDQEWTRAQEWAASVGMTASAYIRAAVEGLRAHQPKDDIDVAIKTVSAQAERDRILRRVNKAGA